MSMTESVDYPITCCRAADCWQAVGQRGPEPHPLLAGIDGHIWKEDLGLRQHRRRPAPIRGQIQTTKFYCTANPDAVGKPGHYKAMTAKVT
jgi:hypothetical protein